MKKDASTSAVEAKDSVDTSGILPTPVSTVESANAMSTSSQPETGPASVTPSTDKPTRGSLAWVLERIQQTTDDTRTLRVLTRWAHRRRHLEITTSLLTLLRTTKVDDSIKILRDLKRPPRWIRRIGQNSVVLPVTLQTLDDRRRLQTEALLDSGATGCYIDMGYARAKSLNLNPLPYAIPVYNADGTPNEAGPIKYTVELRLQIRDHEETLICAVTNTGKSPLIMGFDWLRKHNPLVDWRTGQIVFNRCPSSCHYDAAPQTPPTSATPDPNPSLEEGDRLWVTKIYPTPPPSPPSARHISVATHTSWRSEFQAALQPPPAHIATLDQPAPTPVPEYYYREFASVFEKSEFDRLPSSRKWDHAIELKPGAEPSNSKIYPLTRAEQAELDQFLEEHLRTGRIRPSKSPMASPFFFIKKKDGTLRPVQDYRKLNDITIKNRYPLPLISEVVHKLKGAKYFTKLDVRWGYNNIRIRSGDEWKAAFTTNRGLFEPLVMFFGMTNGPATFQSMMNELFRDLIRRGVVLVYLDDILIFTRRRDEHRRVVQEVLQILKDNQLSLKPEKCEFEREEIEYLGMVIKEGSIAMDPKKVTAIEEWPEPTNRTELQRFLGFANFYRRFIAGFAHIARPLHRLTGQAPWCWNSGEQAAFRALKQAVTTAPTLAIPMDDGKYRVEADSSGYATGAVLSQLQDDNIWRPVAFYSRSLSEVERNYDIFDREMLAIMRALEEWRQYLMGARHTVEIWTDHKNIEYFRSARHLNRRQARWALELAEYDFTLSHKPGRTNHCPDALSRRPDYDTGDNDNNDTILLRPQWFRTLATAITIQTEGDIILERIRSTKKIEKRVRTYLHAGAPDWTREDGVVKWRGRVYVPPGKTLRDEVIRAHHDSPTTGHPGRFKTAELILRNYWWPGIHRTVGTYVRGCEACQRTKVFPAKPPGTLAPNLIPERNWSIVSVDLITQLPRSLGHDAIVVIVDRLSKMIRLVPANGELTSEGLARVYRDHVWKDFGLPDRIISDRGTQFTSNFMRDLNQLLGISTNISTAYHPQTDGQTERINQEIEQYLRLFVNHRQDDWTDWISLAEFCYNDRIHSSTGHSPFFLNHGWHPRKGSEPSAMPITESAEAFASRMERVREDASAALAKAASTMKRYYDQRHSRAPEYKIGDLVYLEASHLRTDRPSRKLDDRRLGPFKILEKVGLRAFRLELPATWSRVHPVFHITHLRPHRPSVSPLQQRPPPPPPVLVGDHYEIEVEDILDERIRRGRTEYLVKWKGLPREENTWEPRSHLEDEHGINVKLQEYLARPGRILRGG